MVLDLEHTALSLVDAHAARNPSHPATIFEGQVLTYGDLIAASHRLAHALVGRGVQPGDRVCMLATNSPDYYVAYFAVLRCGATFFPINPDLAPQEVAHIIAKADPALIITDEHTHLRGIKALAKIPCRHRMASLSQLQQEGHTSPKTRPFPIRSGRDIARVVHTSGTSASPKGVISSDHMETASAIALRDYWDIRTHDISVCSLPLSYTFGLLSASFATFCAGATVLLFRTFHPVRILEGIERHRATFMVGVPTMYAMMQEHIQQTGKHYDLSSIRMMASSGAPITLKAKDDFLATFGIRLRDYYALSECTPIFSFDLRDEAQSPPPGSVGRLVKGAEVILLGDDDQPVRTGAVGALWVRSERLTQGYFLAPGHTENTFQRGWFNTGDLVYQDTQGYYFIVGRIRDQVISGGLKIAATEVESVIARIPGVAQVAVVGSPHFILGEVVKAVVVRQESASAPDTAAIIEFCSHHLAQYKIPREVEFRSSLPTSPAGKVLKRALIQDADAQT